MTLDNEPIDTDAATANGSDTPDAPGETSTTSGAAATPPAANAEIADALQSIGSTEGAQSAAADPRQDATEPGDAGSGGAAAGDAATGDASASDAAASDAKPARTPRKRASRARTTTRRAEGASSGDAGAAGQDLPEVASAAGAPAAGSTPAGSAPDGPASAGSASADTSTPGGGDADPADAAAESKPAKRTRAPRKRATKAASAPASAAPAAPAASPAPADVTPEASAAVAEPAAESEASGAAPAAGAGSAADPAAAADPAVGASAGSDTSGGAGTAAATAAPRRRRRATSSGRATTSTPEPASEQPAPSEAPTGSEGSAESAESEASAPSDASEQADASERPERSSRRSRGRSSSRRAEPAGHAARRAVDHGGAADDDSAGSAVLPAAQRAADDTDEADDDRPAAIAMPLFQAPEPVAPRRRRAASRPAGPPVAAEDATPEAGSAGEAAPGTGPDDATALTGDVTDPADAIDELDETETDETGTDEAGTDETDAADETDGDDAESDDAQGDDSDESSAGGRRRRRRGGRGRRGRGRSEGDEPAAEEAADDAEESAAEGGDEGDEESAEDGGEESGGSSRRRRRRRRRGTGSDATSTDDDPPNTTTRVRSSRGGGGGRDDATGIKGSTRLEAKKQRRREGREAGRRRSILSEAEFLARREAVERVMVVREREGRTQIGVLEDDVLVEHYVARKTQTSMVGNVYLGRVQNVLPSMEAAFVDIGKGRNAVLYAGEVNWDAAGLDGQPRRIEHALKAGQAVLVQVTKDPVGHKGARLTSQISMPGRYLVYVPDGSMTGISRKLPDTERSRLKKILRAVVPDDAGVIVRTAAEGASDEELERDVVRLQAQWEDIKGKIDSANAPALLYGEPDLAIRVVRDVFNEDFTKLVVSGDEAWETLQGYISHVAPDLAERLEKWDGDKDIFAAHRIDEQIHKALDRKVWLPSGGSLVIDRTEAMTVVDVNTGKFTGAGGNLEETVTKNNLEAAEEVVRQLRLRDIGGIIVVDFIDMVLESNRELVMRRLLECLGRDRTRHQVAEVTSLGLVQMTRKRVGQGLVEVFSETCEHCGGRGVIMHDEPVEKKNGRKN